MLAISFLLYLEANELYWSAYGYLAGGEGSEP